MIGETSTCVARVVAGGGERALQAHDLITRLKRSI
jgi:hypothetical protein